MQKKKHILIILQIRSLLSFVTFANDPKRLVVVSRQAIGDTRDSDGQIVVYIARRCAPFSIIFFVYERILLCWLAWAPNIYIVEIVVELGQEQEVAYNSLINEIVIFSWAVAKLLGLFMRLGHSGSIVTRGSRSS